MDASVNRIPSSKDERAILIGIRLNRQNPDEIAYSLEELALLVKTAGAIVVEKRIVNREKIDPSRIVGKGFLDKVKEILEEKKIRLVVFDLNTIRPAQVRNLEDICKCRVVGRNEVIMDIFARRARSNESKIQVELAQLRYILPRLKGLGGVLSRLGGGIGTRGPGETMLETDRRHILSRISVLKKKLNKIQEHRGLTRKARKTELHGSVIGYTNAGKSTFINFLAKDDLFVEDRLFATLDSYTRSVFLEEGKKALLTDTVGFIRNMPANLIESFRSTLEEIAFSDFLVHCVDITAPDIATNIRTVEKELANSDARKPVILFFNKADLVTDEHVTNTIQIRYPDAIIGSAHTGDGMQRVKNRIIDLYMKEVF